MIVSECGQCSNMWLKWKPFVPDTLHKVFASVVVLSNLLNNSHWNIGTIESDAMHEHLQGQQQSKWVSGFYVQYLIICNKSPAQFEKVNGWMTSIVLSCVLPAFTQQLCRLKLFYYTLNKPNQTFEDRSQLFW